MRAFLAWWLGGLALFALAIWLHLPLAIEAVPGGIGDHQAAGTAEEVERIHAAWRAAGVYGAARAAMIADLVFIGVYAVGSFLGGRMLRASGGGVLRLIGDAVIAGAIVFGVTDYIETICQFVQLMQGRGSDALAAIAATVQPVKIIAWIVTFAGILAGLAVRRFVGRSS